MSTTRITVDPDDPATFPKGRLDPAVVDGITEAEIVMQEQEDDAEAMQDAARYARRDRRRGSTAGGPGCAGRSGCCICCLVR